MDNKRELVISYLVLRRMIGFLGMSLPVIVSGGAWLIFSVGLQGSLSAYYHTPMRDVYVGLVFFLTGFFWSYRGYSLADSIAGRMAALFGWLFSIFPAAQNLTALNLSVNLHYAFSLGFFITLIFISGFLFTKSDPGKPPTPQKLKRNVIYRVCAVVMGVSMGLGMLLSIFPSFDAYHPTFWGETIAIEAFGLSWFVKGEGILKDDERAR